MWSSHIRGGSPSSLWSTPCRQIAQVRIQSITWAVIAILPGARGRRQGLLDDLVDMLIDHGILGDAAAGHILGADERTSKQEDDAKRCQLQVLSELRQEGADNGDRSREKRRPQQQNNQSNPNPPVPEKVA